ncbi:hypothetical protein GCM10025794_24800 [Massilia kyonggiensis]|jgi:hypothetical protein
MMASKEDTQPSPAMTPEKTSKSLDPIPIEDIPLENTQKSRWERSWPTIACGAGLFSDGYLNGVCDTLGSQYHVQLTTNETVY